MALARIDAATRRIETAAERTGVLRTEASAALAELDRLIGTLET